MVSDHERSALFNKTRLQMYSSDLANGRENNGTDSSTNHFDNNASVKIYHGGGGGDGGEGGGAGEGGAQPEGEGEKEGFSFLKVSARKKGTFLLLGFANFAACACFSLLAPFFPAEAAAKGMSESVTGLVFSCFEFWFCLTSAVLGNYIGRIGPRFLFLSGQFMAGGVTILFGFVNMCPSGTTFIVMCFVLRTFQALGASAFATASFTLIANEFPECVTTVYGALETFTGMGYVVGPLLGGALYDIGGFGLPFYTAGVFLLASVIISHYVMPREESDEISQRKKGSVLYLLRSPLVCVACFTIVFGGYTLGFFDASFALHVAQFSLSSVVVGALFMVLAGIYAASAPIFGWISDKKNITYPFVIAGTIMLSIGLLLIGPSPLLPFLKTEIWLIVVSMIFMGVGIGATIVPALGCIYVGARRLGLKDGLELDGAVSGLLNAALHLGIFLGPTVGSSVMQAVGYEWSSTLNAGLCFLSLVCLCFYVLAERTCMKEREGGSSHGPASDTTYLVQPSRQD